MIGFGRVPLSIDNRSSPPNIFSIISFLFLLSPPFSTNLYDYRRSHDIDVVNRYSDFAIFLAIITDVVGLKGVGSAIGKIVDAGVPMPGNTIGDVAIPSIGIGDVTLLFVGIALPDVALAESGVATLDMFNIFPDPFDASAAVTLVEIICFSCSGVVGILSTTVSCLSTLIEDASGEDDVAGNDPASGPLFRLLLQRIDDSLSIV